ncbi:MAG: class I SAM-dependent methyltransferase [Acidobacteriota bacterium]
MSENLLCPCGINRFVKVHTFVESPPVEVQFAFSGADQYQRELMKCEVCGHFISVHDMDTSALYSGDYATSNYGDFSGITATFDKIINLAPERSDNDKRVKRVLEFTSSFWENSSGMKVLDVGSGLCVFLKRMKDAGWDCTALDPDPQQVRHAQENVGVKTVLADFMEVAEFDTFDLITINRVLEHVENPIEMLSRAGRYLKPNGLVYIELPDGEDAIKDGPEREEFTIDHFHIFSFTSMALMVNKAGFELVNGVRVREPSGKYTIYGFCKIS